MVLFANPTWDSTRAILHMRRIIAREQLPKTDQVEQSRASRKRRFDAEAFYSAIDAERRSRRQTWKLVAEEARVSASTLTRMGQGRRPDVDSMAALIAWSGLSADMFVKDAQATPGPSSLSVISTSLKSDPYLTPEAAEALDELMRATYERMRKKD